jgi:hypothetical protein
VQNTTYDMIAVFDRRQSPAPIADAHPATCWTELGQINLGNHGQVGNDTAIVSSLTADESRCQCEQRECHEDGGLTVHAIAIGGDRHLDNTTAGLGQVGFIVVTDAEPPLLNRSMRAIQLGMEANAESGRRSSPPALRQLGQVLRPQWSAWPPCEPVVDRLEGIADYLKPRLILDLDPAPEITRPCSGLSSQPRWWLVDGEARAHLAD